MKATITTNKGNWSGEEATVVADINEDQQVATFEYYDYSWTVTAVSHDHGKYGGTTYKLDCPDWEETVHEGFTDGVKTMEQLVASAVRWISMYV